MEIVTRPKRRFVLPLAGVLLLLAPLAGSLVQHDLEATQTVGLQSRARRHARTEAETGHQTAVRCAVSPERRKVSFEQCDKDERKRDDAFYRAMPRKRSNSK